MLYSLSYSFALWLSFFYVLLLDFSRAFPGRKIWYFCLILVTGPVSAFLRETISHLHLGFGWLLQNINFMVTPSIMIRCKMSAWFNLYNSYYNMKTEQKQLHDAMEYIDMNDFIRYHTISFEVNYQNSSKVLLIMIVVITG